MSDPERPEVALLMDSREVASRLKVSQSTLSRWRASGEGPPYLRLGGIARYKPDAVNAWMDAQEHGRVREG